MKNFELKFWLSCMMMALCLGFTSCGDDDEGIEGDANELIIGDWKVVDEYGWYKYQDEETGKWVKEEYGKEDGDYINEIFSFKKMVPVRKNKQVTPKTSLGKLMLRSSL